MAIHKSPLRITSHSNLSGTRHGNVIFSEIALIHDRMHFPLYAFDLIFSSWGSRKRQTIWNVRYIPLSIEIYPYIYWTWDQKSYSNIPLVVYFIQTNHNWYSSKMFFFMTMFGEAVIMFRCFLLQSLHKKAFSLFCAFAIHLLIQSWVSISHTCTAFLQNVHFLRGFSNHQWCCLKNHTVNTCGTFSQSRSLRVASHVLNELKNIHTGCIDEVFLQSVS